MHPFGNASMGMRRLNPLPYSPMLTRFDQDGDGDVDVNDIKISAKEVSKEAKDKIEDVVDDAKEVVKKVTRKKPGRKKKS